MAAGRLLLTTWLLLLLAGSRPAAGDTEQLVKDCGIRRLAYPVAWQRERKRRDLPVDRSAHRGYVPARSRGYVFRPFVAAGTALPDIWYDPNAPQSRFGAGRRRALAPWPWLVLLGTRLTGGVRFDCGGTLLSHDLLLTAAHCVKGRSVGSLVARLGEYSTATTADGPHVDLSVSRVVAYPGYSKAHGTVNDIALVQLKGNVRFTPRIQPICLPEDDDDHVGDQVALAGFGARRVLGARSAVLNEANLTVISEGQCEKKLARKVGFYHVYPGGLPDTILCASGTLVRGVAKDACQGDSGGPLVYASQTTRVHELVGVVSTGIGCGNPNYPGIYTRVSKFVPWILKTAKSLAKGKY